MTTRVIGKRLQRVHTLEHGAGSRWRGRPRHRRDRRRRAGARRAARIHEGHDPALGSRRREGQTGARRDRAGDGQRRPPCRRARPCVTGLRAIGGRVRTHPLEPTRPRHRQRRAPGGYGAHDDRRRVRDDLRRQPTRLGPAARPVGGPPPGFGAQPGRCRRLGGSSPIEGRSRLRRPHVRTGSLRSEVGLQPFETRQHHLSPETWPRGSKAQASPSMRRTPAPSTRR